MSTDIQRGRKRRIDYKKTKAKTVHAHLVLGALLALDDPATATKKQMRNPMAETHKTFSLIAFSPISVVR